MDKINLLIIEDNRLLREGLKSITEKRSGFNVKTATGNGENVLKLIISHDADVLLMDISLPEHDNIEFITSLSAKFPELKIILMGFLPADHETIQYIEAGVSGFVLKDASPEDFLESIRLVAGGEKVLPDGMTKSLFSVIAEHGINQYGVSKMIESVRMTRREREVVALIAQGLSNKEIADKLHLSTYTVKSHVHNILEKMSLNTRVQIAIYARDNDDFNAFTDIMPSNDD